MKLVGAAFLLMLAMGCSTIPEQVVGREYLEKRALAAGNSRKCMDAVKNGSQVYARLGELFIYDLNDNRQLTKMANRNYVTEQNITDLIAFRERIQPCYDQSLADYGSADRRYAEYMLAVRTSSDDNLLALLNRRITIGERNVFLLETLHSNRSRFAEIDREVITEISRAHYLQTTQGRREFPAIEESYLFPATPLSKEDWRLPTSGQERSETPAGPRQGAGGRCRFEGTTIRCD